MVEIILRSSREYLADLKRRLEKYKISQNALAKEMQPPRNPTQVSRWFTDNEERRVSPELDTIVQIEEAVERLRKRKARF